MWIGLAGRRGEGKEEKREEERERGKKDMRASGREP
jgi:hypothetical protein